VFAPFGRGRFAALVPFGRLRTVDVDRVGFASPQYASARFGLRASASPNATRASPASKA